MVAQGSEKRLRTLHLGKYAYHSVEAGGVESVLKTYTEHLKNDIDQIVLVFDSSIQKKISLTENGITIIRFPVHLIAGYAPVNFFMFFYLRKIIHSFSPDIIHVHMPGLMPFFCLCDLKKRKTIVHWQADVDGTRVSKNLAFPFYKILEQRLLNIADVIITTSFQYLDAGRALKPFKKKCIVIPIGINQNQPDVPSEESLSPDISNFIKNKTLILSIGRLAYYKGYHFLVQAMGYIEYDNAVLVIAGQGPERKFLEKTIQQYNLKDRVFLPGKISESDKKQLLSKACIFCLPSIDRAESFGVSIVEAMAYSLPLITADIKGSGMNHVNIHNKTGLKVAPCDSRALANSLNRLLSNPEFSKKLGKNGRRRFLDHFQSRDMAAQIKKHY